MKYYKIIFCLIYSTFILSISQGQKMQSGNMTFFSKENFYKDTLYIKVQFSECGEWGGHEELSKIYSKGNNFYVNYKKYKADCDKIKENNGKPGQLLMQNRTKALSTHDKLLIRKYMHEALDAKFVEQNFGNVGYVFQIYNSDNSINIWVYTWNEKTKNEYLNFIKQLL